MSSCVVKQCCRGPESCEDFAGDVAFQATDDLCFAQSLPGPAKHISPGPLVMAQPDHDDTVKGSVGLAVSTSVQPVPVCLAGRSGYRAHPTQRREGSVGVETFRVAAGSDQQGGRRVRPNTVDTHQGWRRGPDQSLQLSFQFLDLLAELTVSAGKGAKCVLGRRRRIH